MPTPAQQALIDAVSAALISDTRIEAAWIAGSLGRNAGDTFSDVDVLVLCPEGPAGEVSSAWGKDIARIAEPVLAMPLFGGRVLSVVTADWQRFDLTFIEPAQLSNYSAAHLKTLFNRGDRTPPVSAPAPYRTEPKQIEKLVNEFFRIMGLSVVGFGREEYVVSLSGIELLRRLTIDLMIEENGIAPADRGGALHLNRLITAEQRRTLEALPPVAANRQSVLAANQAIAAVFLPLARRLAAAVGLDWPEAFEAATRAHLRRNLGLELPKA